jgi:hypothetical protein
MTPLENTLPYYYSNRSSGMLGGIVSVDDNVDIPSMLEQPASNAFSVYLDAISNVCVLVMARSITPFLIMFLSYWLPKGANSRSSLQKMNFILLIS